MGRCMWVMLMLAACSNPHKNACFGNTSANCISCIQTHCDQQASACYGSAWASGTIAGVCGSTEACSETCCDASCQQCDQNCTSQCYRSAPQDCAACLPTFSTCLTNNCNNECNMLPDAASDGPRPPGGPCYAPQDCESFFGCSACTFLGGSGPPGMCLRLCHVGANDCPVGQTCESNGITHTESGTCSGVVGFCQ